MPRGRLSSILVALLLAVFPATALADGGAGDNQYQDPLAATPVKKPKKKPAPKAPAATTAPATTPAPAPPTSTVASSTTPAADASASSRQLPRTGAPAGLIGLSGVGLTAGGLLLRRRTATQ